VILDSVGTERPVDSLIPLVWPWKEDAEEDEAARRAGEIFQSTRISGDDQKT
jgi:hypothetical protein